MKGYIKYLTRRSGMHGIAAYDDILLSVQSQEKLFSSVYVLMIPSSHKVCCFDNDTVLTVVFHFLGLKSVKQKEDIK